METKQVVVTGTICELQRVVKTFKSGKKSEEKLFISLKNVNVNDKKMEIFKQAFAEVKKNFIPAWVDDFKGYINTSTKFELPCRYRGKTYNSIEDLVADGFKYYNAKVRVILNVKESAIYPYSVDILEEGEDVDKFAAFDEDDAYEDDLPFEEPTK